jgi:hypothetical protein
LDADHFIRLAGGLTGTPVKEITATDRDILGQLLGDDGRTIGHSQLNELLLLVNKDRMERAFFDYFFGDECTVGTLPAGVLRFQKLAMLCHGNFIFAFRTLSRAPSVAALEGELGEWARRPKELRDRFAGRSPKLADIDLIPREHTSLVGYISAGEVVAEGERCTFLRALLPAPDALPGATWEAFEAALQGAAGAAELPALRPSSRTTRGGTPGPPSASSPSTSRPWRRYLRGTPPCLLRFGRGRLGTRTSTSPGTTWTSTSRRPCASAGSSRTCSTS